MHLKNLIRRRYRCCNDTILIGICCVYRNIGVRPTTAWQSTQGSQVWANFTYKIIKYVSGSRFHVFLMFADFKKFAAASVWFVINHGKHWTVLTIERCRKRFSATLNCVIYSRFILQLVTLVTWIFFKLEFIYLKLWHFSF